ncbi:hypothetical protein NDS46_09810 [Paenibacillus thiaminolyticus]|uniref:hypothetical protein n=1 Tax=Paenibacillus thiaminolyticus TaxID=49283 RepID=UPI00232F8954|nr:hypothetical protein [Paenibacillus thiaminolyticus]WCF10115.1 hypothetical protein NDS46_09810 [Paenibacillus thiaminolyticus]
MTEAADVRHWTGQRGGRSSQRGGARINEVKIDDPNAELLHGHGDIVQAGKRKFAKVKLLYYR